MGEAYYSQDDAYMRLNGTICMLNGVPKYISVEHRGEHGLVRAYDMEPKLSNYKTVDYRDPGFNYKPFPLGYLNYENNAFYMARKPSRNQHQGLEKYCVVFTSRQPDSYYKWFTCKEMENTILNIYWGYEAALDKVMSEHDIAAAFHRDFAVRAISYVQQGIEYKGRLIGTKGRKENHFTLFKGEDTSFMLRLLEKQGIKAT